MRKPIFSTLTCALLALVAASCSRKTALQHGLELLIASDLPTPAAFDSVSIRISTQLSGADGGFAAAQFSEILPHDGKLTLPATFAIAAGESPSRVALIQVTALANRTTPIILREVRVAVPTDRIAELPIILSSRCQGQLTVDDAGVSAPTCPLGQSCDPRSGMCSPETIDDGQLPPYTLGDVADAGAIATDAADDAKADSPPTDSGSDSTIPDSGGKDAAHDATDATLAPDASDASPPKDAADASDGSAVEGGEGCPSGLSYCADAGCIALTTQANCGACGNVCTAPSGGTTSCAGAGGGFACQPVCSSGTLCTNDNSCADLSSDNQHCGRCDLRCNACSAGECTVALTDSQAFPTGVAIDSTSIYWADNQGAAVMKSNLDGTQLTTLASGQTGAAMVAVDSSHVYWTASGLTDGGAVMASDLNGQSITTLASDQSNPWGIAVDSTNVYWTNNNAASTVMAVHTDGTGLVTLASGQDLPQGIAAQAGVVFWTNAGNHSSAATIARAQADGSGLATIVTGQQTPEFIAADSTAIYWTNGDGTVMSALQDGGAVTTLATGQANAWGIAVHGTTVYWNSWGAGGASSATGTVVKMPLGGTAVVTMAAGQQTPYGIAVDDNSVYWTNEMANGAVMRATPN